MRTVIWKCLRWFLFQLDAERAHRLTVSLLQLGMKLGPNTLRIVSGAPRVQPNTGRVQVFGMEFGSRVGLAAGFDKDAELLEALPQLGFGYAEIGTITPLPQPGNDRPRLFRDAKRDLVFNRMGFNGLGATLAAERLANARPKLPAGFRIGVNVGKNKATPLDQAARDYGLAARAFNGLADYLVINVSSPNTPGLRSLQTTESLRPLVQEVAEEISKWSNRPPLLLKLAPEVPQTELAEIIPACETWGIDGWVLTNTLAGTWERGSAAPLAGGYSGAPLTVPSRNALSTCRALTRLPIISVGGILSPEEAMERIKLGADLIQLYSGWILKGPEFPVRVAQRLLAL